ncbi:MAG: HemK2/MTQ2 family protein methyltransferase [Candidatus Hydrothermarchaeales archaeon]
MMLFGLNIETGSGVYEPAEDTFLLADSLLNEEYGDVLEIGTGTGILALICAARAKRVVAVDIGSEAVMCARQNARRNGIENVDVIRGDLFGAIRKAPLFDLIIFNPPYLPEDGGDGAESLAWSGGEDGRRVIDRFLVQFRDYLKDGGRILTIGSSLSDYEGTINMLEELGFETRVLAKKKFFFEELALIEAIPKGVIKRIFS